MSYKEPGVYLDLVNARSNTATPSSLIPVILGEGPKYMDHRLVPVVAAAGGKDTLPSTKVTAIIGVYLTLTGTAVDSSNYTFSSVDNSITWGTSAPSKPTAGATYYVTYEARPESLQYQGALISSFDDLDTAYGGQFMKTVSAGAATAVNPVYLGAFLALEAGAPAVYCVQVEPADKTGYGVVTTDYTASLANVVTFIPDGYQIVPMSQDPEITGAVISHVNANSTPDERRERVAFVSKKMTATTTNGVVTTAMATEITAYVTSLDNKRVIVPFIPSYLTKTLSDGNVHQLTGEYFCAALAGLDAVIPAERALTRQKILNFIEIKDNKMTRAMKNQVAGAGVIVLEQPGGSGSAIVIRHGVSTDMSSVANREYSITKICDYTSKFLRNSLDGYIGIFNIDDFFITKVKGTITACFNALKTSHKINDGVMSSVAQDADSPDTLLVSVSIKPPYPCNYIDITLVVE